jgi:hypothetical protein
MYINNPAVPVQDDRAAGGTAVSLHDSSEKVTMADSSARAVAWWACVDRAMGIRHCQRIFIAFV